MPRRLVPLTLLAVLLSAPAFAELQPPAGYHAPVGQRDGKAPACSAPPQPYTGELQFTSKYAGSDSARATLNRNAEKNFRKQTEGITRLEKEAGRLITGYMRTGQRERLECAIEWLDHWASADALESEQYNHTGKSMRKWALGSLAGAWLRLKFSESQPLADYPQQSERIEAWFVRLAEHTVREWSDLPLKKINNHSYWAAWSVMAVAVIGDRRDLFDWSVGQFRIAAGQVDDEGFLDNEMRRRQRALAYHNYALPPLAMIAAFAQANGVDLRGENHGALQRLAERVLQGARDPGAFAQRTGSRQDMEELRKKFKYAWLAPYCTLYVCNEQTRELNQEMGPFNSFRLGGEVTQVFGGGG
ncbi:poly(beta-D-mannuronate) lyase [Ectopseudomonas mendocina DLHK]|uniref:mannuronate-specific alginate lyase n=1 Tax=Ectopseudomonas hydrolytica TaxID=2493633 RepID=UPI00027876BB|nr:poly(beta-D-mannuronate) lyase [Pseudomonas mendocina DLHK]